MVKKGVMHIIEPWMDPATTVSASTAWRTGRAAEKLDWTVVKFFGAKDWNLVYTRILPLHDPEVVIYTGHGFPDRWLGDDLIFGTLQENQAYLLKDRVVFAVPSCLTARSMGKIAIEEGAVSYIGSKDLVYIAWDEWDHPYRRDFEFSWFTLLFNAISGASMKEALAAYKQVCNRFIDFYKRRDLPNADYYIEALENNRDGMVVLGDSSYRLTAPNQRKNSSPLLSEVETELFQYLQKRTGAMGKT